MSTDLKPTPDMFGWGNLTDTFDERIKIEKEVAELIANTAPHICQSGGIELVLNKPMFNKIKTLMDEDGIDDGLDLTYIEKAAFGKFLEWLAQIIGSCVASGEMRISTTRTMWEVLVLGQLEELWGLDLSGVNSFAAFAPYSYRAGRRIGNMNSGDGSYCSVHIQGMLQYGKLPCWTPGLQSDAFPEPQSASTYRNWGSRSGNSLMDKFVETAKKFVLTESEQNTDADMAKQRLIEEFKPSMICSDWAFAPSHAHPTWKLADGSPVWIYKRDTTTSWPHNMSVVAFLKVAGQWYVKIRNSWGTKAHKNGDYFIIPIEVFAQWLAARYAESRTIGNIQLALSVPPIAW